MGFYILIGLLLFLIAIFLGKTGDDEKCARCGFANTHEIVMEKTEYEDQSIPKAEGAKVNSVFYCRCQHCGYTWMVFHEGE